MKKKININVTYEVGMRLINMPFNQKCYLSAEDMYYLPHLEKIVFLKIAQVFPNPPSNEINDPDFLVIIGVIRLHNDTYRFYYETNFPLEEFKCGVQELSEEIYEETKATYICDDEFRFISLNQGYFEEVNESNTDFSLVNIDLDTDLNTLSLSNLEDGLASAVNDENYELSAKIRDEIAKR